MLWIPTPTWCPSVTDDEIVALSKKHTLFEWTAQSAIDPIPIARAKGVYSGLPMASGSSISTAS